MSRGNDKLYILRTISTQSVKCVLETKLVTSLIYRKLLWFQKCTCIDNKRVSLWLNRHWNFKLQNLVLFYFGTKAYERLMENCGIHVCAIKMRIKEFKGMRKH